MEDETHTGSAIIPEDRNRQLSLPAEMIQGGLELAVRIERNQGIQPLPGNPGRQEYMVCCHLAVMDWLREPGRPPRLTDSDKDITGAPVYLVVSVDQDGLQVACAPSGQHLGLPGITGNEDRYRLLHAANNLDPFIIPNSSFGLFYVLTRPAGQKNLSFKMGPGKGPGYQGPVTKEANPYFDVTRDCVEIIMLYIATIDGKGPERALVSKNPPLKLSLVVVDGAGEKDPVRSRELYHAILQMKDTAAAQKTYVRVEELYRNIPVDFTRQEAWLPWQNTYAGKYVKGKGKIEGITIHPQVGKMFLIVSLCDEEGGLKDTATRLALVIEDAHHASLGEKEGSFLLDDTKWICTGETYAFEGRVSHFSRFDPELWNADYRDLIVVKVKMMDIGTG